MKSSYHKQLKDKLLQIVGQAATLEEYLQAVVEALQDWFRCAAVGLRAWDLDTGWDTKAQVGFSDCSCCCPFLPGELPPEKVLIFDLPGDKISTLKSPLPQREDLQYCSHCRFLKLLVIPVMVRDSWRGMLYLASEKAEQLRPLKIAFLQMLSPVIAAGLLRFISEEKQRLNHEMLIVSHRLLTYALSERNLIKVMEFVLDQLLDLNRFGRTGRGCIFLFDKKSSELKMVASRGLEEEIKHSCATLTLGHRLCGYAARKQEIIFANDYKRCSGGEETINCSHPHICVPIGTGDKGLQGLINLYVSTDYMPTREDKIFLETIAGTLSAIIEHRIMEEELEKRRTELLNIQMQAQRQLRDIIEFLPDATFVINENKQVIAWNRAMEQFTGVAKSEILGRTDYAQFIYGHQRPLLVDLLFAPLEEVEAWYNFVERRGNTLYAEAFIAADGGKRGIHVMAAASPLFDGEGKVVGAIETLRDISERKRMEKQLQFLTYFDPLTGLPNRFSLEENLKKVVAGASRERTAIFVLIDVDNFKLVNDTFGMLAGDEILLNLIQKIKSELPSNAFLARLSGDELGIILENFTVAKAIELAERLRILVNEGEVCLRRSRICFSLSISVGMAVIDGTVDYQKIMARASAALHVAKETGRNRVIVFDERHDPTLLLMEENQVISLLRAALRDDQFIFYFQPIVDLKSGKVSHFEVLLRLYEGDEIILPGHFIPVAERYGLMPQIDRLVAIRALVLLKENRDLSLFINLSAVSLNDNALLAEIEHMISRSNIKTGRLGIEITESAAVKDMAQAERWIKRLKNLGCSFALDDFGIGFSSFAYLRHLPVDYLKIDGTFIRHLSDDLTNQSIVRAINEVAHTLGKKTIAEFIADARTLAVAKQLETDLGQGYLFSRPLPWSNVSPFLNFKALVNNVAGA